tara:strand:+ start:136 stop:363 length:228 start_codon:yes stop_codon:yes gene_type:complete
VLPLDYLYGEQALWGAAGLTRKWRPIIAAEKQLLGTATWRDHLQPLGYRPAGWCPGLYFFTAHKSTHLAQPLVGG